MTPTPAPDDDPPASSILERLAAGSSASVSFGEVVAAAGSRVHGFALLLFVLPETLPLPLPSASSILGIPLVLISAHLAIFGENGGWPKRLDQVHVPRAVISATARYVVPVLRRLEAMSRPAWAGIVERERLIGVICLYLSLLLLAPLPFVNAPPAICIAAISLGLIQRDGRFVVAGVIGTIGLTAALVWVILLIPSLLGFGS